MLVIGLGHFGRHLAIKLAELGNEVMVVDKDEDAVNRIASKVTRAQIGDCMDADVLNSLGVGNFDICFVCISDNFQSSLEITSLLKEMGAKLVVSKTDRDIHAKFLKKIGADEVIYPERDMAQRTAMRFSAKNAFEYFEFTPEYAIFEILVPENWVGKSIAALNVRSRHNISVIGIKNKDHVIPIMDPDYILKKDEHLIITGCKRDLLGMIDK
jgi:trk system potassium uptake protein TrkA